MSYAGVVMRGDILRLERRRRWGDKQKAAIVLSVGMPERQEMVVASEPAAPAPIELRLANDRCLRFDATVDTTTLKRLIRAVEAA